MPTLPLDFILFYKGEKLWQLKRYPVGDFVMMMNL